MESYEIDETEGLGESLINLIDAIGNGSGERGCYGFGYGNVNDMPMQYRCKGAEIGTYESGGGTKKRTGIGTGKIE